MFLFKLLNRKLDRLILSVNLIKIKKNKSLLFYLKSLIILLKVKQSQNERN